MDKTMNLLEQWLSIDWEALRSHPWHRNPGEDGPKESSGFWDQRASDFAAKAHATEARARRENGGL